MPSAEVDLHRWAVIACDQYTSEPDYWKRVEQLVDRAPSALSCIVPEAYLDRSDVQDRIARSHESMRSYLQSGVLEEVAPGFMLVERTLASGTKRFGLMIALDLEQYDRTPGSTALIRATERTIPERVPPRAAIRREAPLEFPHVLVLIDDPDETVIEPLASKREKLPVAYDTELMLGGGHVRGYAVRDYSTLTEVANGFRFLGDPARFRRLYGTDDTLLFPVGDGNHSLAACKAVWDDLSAAGAPPDHPARYALVELVNLRGTGLPFEPIHRVVLGVQAQQVRGTTTVREAGPPSGGASGGTAGAGSGGSKQNDIISLGDASGEQPLMQLPADAVPAAIADDIIQELLDANGDAISVDYVHDRESATRIAKETGGCALLLPAMDAGALVPTVLERGVLPRKAFSLGESEDKRYYLEGRRILPG